MRLEQLVLYGPGDDDRIKFGPRVTVFAGLRALDRMELIETIVDALTGRLSNASVVYTDSRGRRVFADRTGATFADDGVVTPGPSELLGQDPSTVAGLLSLTSSDLGLDARASAAELHEQLAAARAELERLHADHVALGERSTQLDHWRKELASIDRRLASADDDYARWTWLENRRQLDELRTEFTMLDRGDGATDRAILASVDALRTAGSTWADLAAAASELEAEIGSIPDVSAENLARVAATPDAPPATFLARIEAWRAANDALRAAEADLIDSNRTPPAPEDPLVDPFARMDQTRLWAAHARILKAAEAYNAVTAVNEQVSDEDAEAERAVEVAHREVVRAQRVVEERVRPGMIGAAALTVTALLSITSLSPIVSVILVAAAAALVRRLVLIPRAELKAAEAAEAQALTHTNAGSWLGLHLRRLDDMTDSADRVHFEAAANNWIVAQVEWEEAAGGHTVDELTARADEVKARAAWVDPKSIGKRKEQAKIQRESAAAAERSARASLSIGLEHYGFAPGSASQDLDPEMLVTVIGRRIEAGRIARRALKLAALRQREASAAAHLEGVLSRLGFLDGDLESRLDRAIQAIAVARQRQAVATGLRNRTDLEAEIARLNVIVERTRRQGWSGETDMVNPPADPDLLEARRREVAELITSARNPDVVGAQHRYRVGLARVRDLETRLDELAAGPSSLQERLTERLSRTAWIDGANESVPVLIDDAFRTLPLEEKVEVLERLVALSETTQVVILTDDDLLTRWARHRAETMPVMLFELDTADIAVEPSLVSR